MRDDRVFGCDGQGVIAAMLGIRALRLKVSVAREQTAKQKRTASFSKRGKVSFQITFTLHKCYRKLCLEIK